MSGQLRKLKRNQERHEGQEAEEAAEVPDNFQKLPTGRVLSAPVKGEFLAIPALAWVGRRAKKQTPLLMLRLMLFREGDNGARGILEMELPIFEDTELATVAALLRFGWDGRAWPLDPGWPDTDENETKSLKFLLEQAGLGSTLTFPPGEEGIAAQTVKVSRAKGPFLMPPLPEPTEPVDPEKLARFRALCADPKMLL